MLKTFKFRMLSLRIIFFLYPPVSGYAAEEMVQDGNVIANNERSTKLAVIEREVIVGDGNYTASHFSSGLAFSKSDYARQLVPALEKVTVEIPSIAEGEFSGELSRARFLLQKPDEFSQFLEVNGISQVERITKAFSAGVETDPSCKGLRSECIILTDSFSVVIDYYQKKVRLFLSPSWIGQAPTEPEYLSVSGENVIKNKLSTFINKSNYSSTFMIGNEGYSGFGDGFLYHNLDVYNDGHALNDLNYTWLSDNKKALIGRSLRGQYFNYAYGKSFLAGNIFEGVVVGTSEQLNLSKSNNNLSFYSPVPATLTILKGGKAIFKQFVNPGMGSLSYNDLPLGVYQAEVVITADDGSLIHSTPTFIVNDGSMFASDFEFFSQYGTVTEKSLPAYGVGASLPVYSGIALYSSLQSVDSNPHLSVGGEYRNDQFSVSATLRKDNFSRGHDVTFLLQRLSVSYVEDSTNNVVLVESSENVRRRQYVRVNYNHSIGESSNIGYSYDQTDSSFNKSKSYGVQLNTPIWQGVFLSLNYERRAGNNHAYINLSLPLGQHLSGTLMNTYDGSQWRTQTSVQFMDNFNDALSYNLGMTAGLESDRRLNSGVTYNGQHASVSSRGSLSEFGNSYGVQLNSLQVLSKKGIDFINPDKQGNHDSFILLPTEMKDDIDINYSKIGDKNYTFTNSEQSAIGVPSYERYRINAKVKSGGFVFDNLSDKIKENVDLIPGKSVLIQRAHNKVVDNIVKVESSVAELRCEGRGCISLEKIQDDLYRVKMFTVGEVSLMSNNGICYIISEQERGLNQGRLVRLSCENT
ncbi:hypothetical protein LDQ03_04980 [Aeromonas hydrophila]|uniref:hypothetical protein n=1 Tax=Aeromonas hydrophila TaxID=644 RepID=UPI001CDB4973|nr:hypothetical protein [Aeromonas hydrophila]MCA4698426.1 hypothetical protein [Aeromonas hydrophila]